MEAKTLLAFICFTVAFFPETEGKILGVFIVDVRSMDESEVNLVKRCVMTAIVKLTTICMTESFVIQQTSTGSK